MVSFFRSKSGVVALALTLAAGASFAGFKEIRKRSENVFEKKKPMPVKENVVLDFVSEGIIGGGAMYVYPWPATPKPQVTDEVAHNGDFSVEIVLKEDAWSGAQICMSGTANLEPYYEKGGLSLWVKGAKGNEVFTFAMMDNGTYSNGHWQQVTPASSRSYDVISNKKWTNIIVPFKDFGRLGSYWDEALNKRVTNRFNWEGVTCIGLDIEKNRFPSFKIYIDDVQILENAPVKSGGGTAYPFVNEGY